MGGVFSRICGGDASPRKIVVIGDPVCGKSSLIRRLIKGDFDHDIKTKENYVPTVLDIVKIVMKRKRRVQTMLIIYDTAGQENFEGIRRLTYPNTDGIIICFSLDNESSLVNVEENWLPEIRHYCNDVPVLLVGNKADIRDDPSALPDGRNLVPEAKAQALVLTANKMVGYLECSALTGMGVENVFETIAEHAMKRRKVLRNQKDRRFDTEVGFSALSE